ncbi:flagellar motor switch protein FliM [Desulfopila aestuarii]|uniref:Flagellar motor switch protein FliM n=1 Tax=Desulfopila aestuarii DSM 18488 TaxID=1121416 RepID=A0A1M7YDL9_9BACT|nr:FliM/FliN family flagellar motor switch protein [Desulfopila aestuarii]SHO50730.1 flagellar motor switch protein FliM [Desulfopila aestuarii DSM 18488]
MEPILSKQQIADLLAAIKAGKVPLDLDEDYRDDHFLACTPINLFQMAQRKDEQTRIPNFDIILDNFCRNYSISLTNQLQRTFTLTRISMENCEYQEYLAKRKVPGAIGMLNMSPLQHNSLLVFDRQLSYSMIEVMLGASTELDPLQLDRPLTTIELSILKTAMRDACVDIDKSFKSLIDLHSTLVKIENTTRLVSITEPESEVLVGTFHLKVDDLSGEIDLVFPAMTLDPLRDKLRELLMVDVTTRDTWKESLENAIKYTTVDIVAQSGSVTLTIDKILRLNEGDIIQLDYDPNSPLKILIEDQLKFNAIPGTINGRKAISITGVAQEGM